MVTKHVGLTCVALFLVVAFAGALRAPNLILYNGSPSVPRGLYVRISEAPHRGAFVTVRAAQVAPDYARLRAFADPTDLFIKRVAAAGGVHVCAQGDIVTVDGALQLTRAERDSLGRLLPRWTGCRRLRADEVLLLGDTPDSFDGRYWGPTPIGDIEGVWRPLGRAASSLPQEGSAPS